MKGNSRIFLSPPHVGSDEIKGVERVFESNWIAPLGPEVDAFESELASFCKVRGASLLSSGTAAIHLALQILGVSHGDIVIVPSFTFIATANPIRYLNAVPVFVDSERETWNMCPDLLVECIKSCLEKGRRPKAIIIVDLYGMPAQYQRLASICDEYEIPMVEDAAEALGSTYCGEPAGSFGAIGILSFNGNKIITTSGGGALLSNNPSFIERSKFLAMQARDPAPHYQHSEIGYNYRMSNVLAAIGRAQLSNLESKIEARRGHFKFYEEALAPKGMVFPQETSNVRANRWLSTAIFPTKLFPPGSTERVRQHLELNHIESRPLWKPLHLQPVFKDLQSFGGTVSEELFKTGLCLPSGSALTVAEKERVIAKIDEVL